MRGEYQTQPNVGDWIAFYQNGEIVIAEVRYVEDAPCWTRSRWKALTTRGVVEEYLEKRSKPDA